MLHALSLLAVLHGSLVTLLGSTFLALMLHALGLLALVLHGSLVTLLGSLLLAIRALLVGGLVTLLTVLVVLAAFLLYLRSRNISSLSHRCACGKCHQSE